MKSGHDETKDLLPDYLRGALSEEIKLEVRNHLDACIGCKAELLFLSEMMDADDVPDPGELFWKTMPRRVKASVKEENAKSFTIKSLFFRPLSVAATVVILFLAMFLYTKRTDMPKMSPFFKDPLMVTVLDYSDMTEKDIPAVTEELKIDELYLNNENYAGYAYHVDFASLSSKELDGLYEALGKEQKTGG